MRKITFFTVMVVMVVVVAIFSATFAQAGPPPAVLFPPPVVKKTPVFAMTPATFIVNLDKAVEKKTKNGERKWYRSWNLMTEKVAGFSKGMKFGDISFKGNLKNGKIVWLNPKDQDKSITLDLRFKGDDKARIGYRIEF
jgi:hypothetical protein